MKRKHGHFARNALLVASCYVALIVVAWLAVGFGAAVIAATGAGALIALAVAPVVIYEEEQQLLTHRRPGR